MQKKGFPIWICCVLPMVAILVALFCLVGSRALLVEGLLTLVTGLSVLAAALGNRALFRRRTHSTRDTWVFVLCACCLLLCAIPAILDTYYWQLARVPGALIFLGMALLLAAYYLLFRCYGAHPYHAAAMYGEAITEDDTKWGPYNTVRHPYALAALLVFAGMPLLLGSFLGYAGAVLGMAILGVRTNSEDNRRFLQYDWYVEYTTRVKSRVVPRVW